jgi:hypothetical protein
MQSIHMNHRAAAVLAALAGLAVLAVSTHWQVGQVAIIRKAAGIGETAEGLEGFVNTCNALVTPLLVAAAAAMPLAVIGGGVAMAFGSRKGLQIILTALGMLAVLGSVTGIVK